MVVCGTHSPLSLGFSPSLHVAVVEVEVEVELEVEGEVEVVFGTH